MQESPKHGWLQLLGAVCPALCLAPLWQDMEEMFLVFQCQDKVCLKLDLKLEILVMVGIFNRY